MKKNIYNIGLLAAVGFSAIITGCSNDFDFDEARRENPEFVYKENFEKAFGTIDPNQSWDFTGGKIYGKTRAGMSDAISKDKLNATCDKWSTSYTPVYDKLYNNILSSIQEGKPNKKAGENFMCTVPNNGFKITPIYQGANVCIDVTFHMVLVDKNDVSNTIDYTLWTKGSHMQYKKESNSNWQDVTNDNKGGTTMYNKGGSSNTPVYAIQSQTLTIDKGDLPAGYMIYFYTTAIDTDENCPDCNGKGTKNKQTCPSCNGEKHRHYKHYSTAESTTEKAEILQIQASKIASDAKSKMGIDESHEIMIITCEAGADTDLNDVLFLIEGAPHIPQPLIIENGEYDNPTTETKRYMVEDLGATNESDIDFNDIVIELTKVENEHHKTVIEKGEIVEDKITSSTNTSSASVLALGGTKNLAVYIQSGTTPAPSTDRCIFVKQGKQNNTTYYNNTATSNGFEASYMYNTVYSSNTEQAKLKNHLIDYDTDITLATVNLGENAGWDPDKNNIYVVVSDKQSVGLGYDPDETDRVIGFPEDGTVPFMIAVDKDTPWNWERANIFQTLDANTGHVLQLKDGSEWSLKDYPKK